MAYIGRGLDKISNIELLDAITFTDSAGPYNITQNAGATAFVPTASNALVISIDGVVQDPSSYTTSVATITFDSVMAATSTMNFMYQIGVGVITAPSDDSVTTAKLADEAVTEPKLAATGTPSSSTYLRGDMAWSTVTVGQMSTINTFFSNWNSVDSNITTTLVATKNEFLCGEITVADTYTWDIAGTGTLTII